LTAYVLESGARLADAIRAPEAAVVLWSAGERQRQRIGVPMPPPDAVERTEILDRLAETLGDDTFNRARARGDAMSSDEARRFALDL
ncbi:MAG: hypothetical protein KDC38_09725, partial [Planctomycetes bacterium]|nr:hypothetical protein [Planctomycetota bacterium]